jgi:hypothetical protein
MDETVLIEYVAAGETIEGACGACGMAGQSSTGMYALAESGPVLIGLMISCEACGSIWSCRYCAAVLPLDGRRVFGHVEAFHAV